MQSAATTGTPSPAAEPPPTTRARASSAYGAVYMFLIAGLVMFAGAVLATDAKSLSRVATVLAGGVSALLGFGLITGSVRAVALGWAGALLGVVLAISALAVSEPQLSEWARLVGAGTLLFSSFGLLATLARGPAPSRAPDEPAPPLDDAYPAPDER